jgi:hypothetical protein
MSAPVTNQAVSFHLLDPLYLNSGTFNRELLPASLTAAELPALGNIHSTDAV